MCDHEHTTERQKRRGFLKVLGGAFAGLVGLVAGFKAAGAAETCGAKCISLPYDGGTCTKPKNPFHQFHKCSKGHTW